MAQQVVIAGALFNDVPSISVPDSNSVWHPFVDPSVTTAAASDVASGKLFIAADGTLTTGTASGGGGGLTLLKTESLGSVSYTSTTATSLNKSITISNCNGYELLLVETTVSSITASRHAATIVLLLLGTSRTSKTAISTYGYWNAKANNKANVNIASNSTSCGIYPNSSTISSGTVTLPMYVKYNSSATSTIDGTYTTRVYGMSLYDLAGV